MQQRNLSKRVNSRCARKASTHKVSAGKLLAMIPFLHLGPVTLPTYGLMVALAMLVSFYVLRADFRRRGIKADAELFIAIPCLAGIVGAKLYHVLESPADFFAHPWSELFSQFGFAWFGGLLAGFGAFVWLARREGIPLLTMMDAGSLLFFGRPGVKPKYPDILPAAEHVKAIPFNWNTEATNDAVKKFRDKVRAVGIGSKS